MKKWIYISLVVAIVFLLFSLIGPHDVKISPIGTMIAELATALGIFGVFYQFKSEKELTEADFIFRVNLEFMENESINTIYHLLEDSKNKKQQEDLFGPEHTIPVANYLTQFDLFNHLLERRVIKIQTLDSILAYRFFLAVNNQYVQKLLLNASDKDTAWEQLYLLYDKWAKYRKSKNKPIWQSEFALSKTDTYKRILKST